MSYLGGIIFLITFIFGLFIHGIKSDSVDLRSSIVQNDAKEHLDITFCQSLYPFSYSKCLKICSSRLEPTCIDDQLCVCDINYSKPSIVNELQSSITKFGVTSTARCELNEFCEESCQATRSESGQTFTTGVLCGQITKDFGPIKMCVCL